MGLLNCNLVFAIIAAAFGSGFQHGYHTGVINVPQEIIMNWVNASASTRFEINIDKTMLQVIWGVTTSTMNIGGTMGGLLSGVMAGGLGRKCGLIVNNLIAGVAIVLMGIAKWIDSVEALVVGRFFIGVACGLFCGLCPLYLSEISPVTMRGAIGSMYQLVITISIMVAQIAGMNFVLGTEDLWNLLFLVPLAIVLFQVICLMFACETPKYLISKNKEEKSLEALKWLRKTEDVGPEMNELKAEHNAGQNAEKVTIAEMFKNVSLRKPLLISLFIMAAQQLSGINAVIFYSTSTFESVGMDRQTAQYATLGIGAINVLMTIVSVFLVDRAGRKTLLLIGFGGMAIDTALLTVCLHFGKDNEIVGYLSVLCVFVYIILFAAGAGSIPWFIVTELFNQSARGTAVSMAVPTNWIVNFIVTLSFPPIEGLIGPFVFIIFVSLDVFFFLMILWYVPETKNKTIEEITALFKS